MVTALRFLILSLVFSLSSCVIIVPNRIKNKFSYYYSSETDYSNSEIKLNGYYVNIEPFERPNYDLKTGKKTSTTIDTTYSNMLFFSDGIVVRGFVGIDCGNCDIESNSQFLFNVSQNKQPETSVYYGNNWGVYKIIGDTIKMQVVSSQPLLNPYWNLFEYWYIININGSLTSIIVKNLIDGRESTGISEITDVFKFVETNLQLPSDTWLKNKKWFWCDKEEYKKWKKEKKDN